MSASSLLGCVVSVGVNVLVMSWRKESISDSVLSGLPDRALLGNNAGAPKNTEVEGDDPPPTGTE